MTCRRIDEFLLASLDQPLDAAQQAEVDVHLAECPACVGRMKDYVVMTHVLRGLGPIEEAQACPPLPEGLVTRILAARKADQGSARRSRTA